LRQLAAERTPYAAHRSPRRGRAPAAKCTMAPTASWLARWASCAPSPQPPQRQVRGGSRRVP